MSEVIRVSAVRRTATVEVEVPGTDPNSPPQVEVYTLREMMGYDRKEYMHRTTSELRVVDGEAKNLGFKGQELDLISRCMYDMAGLRVTVDALEKSLPSTAVGVLFRACQNLNGLGRTEAEDEDEAKKD